MTEQKWFVMGNAHLVKALEVLVMIMKWSQEPKRHGTAEVYHVEFIISLLQKCLGIDITDLIGDVAKEQYATYVEGIRLFLVSNQATYYPNTKFEAASVLAHGEVSPATLQAREKYFKTIHAILNLAPLLAPPKS